MCSKINNNNNNSKPHLSYIIYILHNTKNVFTCGLELVPCYINDQPNDQLCC